MSSLNQVVLSGRVASPELKTLASGSSVFHFRLAVDQYSKDGNDVFFIDVDVWNAKQAEALYKIVTKGMKLTVAGNLKYQKWEDKEGNERSKFSVVASQVDLPPKGSKTDDDEQVKPAYSDNDIPF